VVQSFLLFFSWAGLGKTGSPSKTVVPPPPKPKFFSNFKRWPDGGGTPATRRAFIPPPPTPPGLTICWPSKVLFSPRPPGRNLNRFCCLIRNTILNQTLRRVFFFPFVGLTCGKYAFCRSPEVSPLWNDSSPTRH